MYHQQSTENEASDHSTYEYEEAQERIKKIRKFYQSLAKWAGVSVFLIVLNIILTGSITWAKFPVLFWGLALVIQVFEVIRLQRMDRAWEERQMRRFTGRGLRNPQTTSLPNPENEGIEDYSGELLNKEERELADLAEYRKLNKPWNEEDLV